MTKAAQRHMARVAQLPCCVCGTMPVEVHHIVAGRTPGRRSPDWLTIPCCPDCHRGSHNGIHGEARLWSVVKMDEQHALAQTLEMLYGGVR